MSTHLPPETVRARIFERIKEIPSIPASAVVAFQMLQDPDSSAAELAAAIERDAGVAANVLRLANSALFGSNRTIGNIREAVVRLGRKHLSKVIAASLAASTPHTRVEGYDLPAGWLHSHAAMVAAGTDALTDELQHKASPFLFTAALLHDLGKLVMSAFLKEELAQVTTYANREATSFLEAERSILGTDHAEVGAALLSSWSIPDEVVNLVRWHHEPDLAPAVDNELYMIHIADVLSIISGIGGGVDGLNYHICETAAKELGITPLISQKITCRMLEVQQELAEFFRSN